ncbi:MAG: YcgL domain-containing protein [Succinivibrio sp.]|nr:YcgL domain-containing protein [Succinivibrio sp.]
MADRIVFVYKSLAKTRRFLYLAEKDAFARVPSALLDAFGPPKFVMMFALDKHKDLPKVKPEELEKSLAEKGYFLRIDLVSEEENLLNEERRWRGLPPLDQEKVRDFFH